MSEEKKPYHKPELKQLQAEGVPAEVKAEFETALAQKAMLEDYSGVEKRGRGIDPLLVAQILFWLIVSAIVLWRVFGY
jgi:hypothetical protein